MSLSHPSYQPQPKALANAIRLLSIDAINQAGSGHPGMPMGMADIAEVLWREYLKHNPSHPKWWNRDRFVVSNGHGSMLHYSLLHLSGYDLSLEEIKNFRQLDSKTPGHPEVDETPGVETTTGPLGQGIANAVGMALAEQQLAALFNTDSHKLVDHFTYVFMGDGCLMEGISHEVCSLAGTLGLGKLVAFWDDNQISIDGNVDGWFTDNTVERFRSYGWQVIPNVDGHDREEIFEAIKNAKAEQDRPTLICCKTTIGYGSPNKAGSAASHGAALGAEEAELTRKNLGWDFGLFEIPENYYRAWDAKPRGQEAEKKWQELWVSYQEQYPEKSQEFAQRMNNQLPNNWDSIKNNMLENAVSNTKSMATRKSSEFCLNQFANKLPGMIGGSADLTASNNTKWSEAKLITHDQPGDYIQYGVREFGMAAMMTGLALHGGFIPFGGTFLVFSDYARNAIRMAALMQQRVVYVLTHDSIGLGEDGPTHQAVEHIASLRLMPNLNNWRPCDTTETAVAWQSAIENQTGPTALLLSRQNTQVQTRNKNQIENIHKGGYVLFEPEGGEQAVTAIIMATGSEVELAMSAAKKISGVRVVSMPCVEIFLQQTSDYQDTVLLPHIKKRLAVEAGVSDGWYRFVGFDGEVMGVDDFGKSAPAKQIFEYFGLVEEGLVDQLELL